MDMLVRDIYGGAYSLIGLREDIIASSFGKAARSPRTATTSGIVDASSSKVLFFIKASLLIQGPRADCGLLAYKKVYGLKQS